MLFFPYEPLVLAVYSLVLIGVIYGGISIITRRVSRSIEQSEARIMTSIAQSDARLAASFKNIEIEQKGTNA